MTSKILILLCIACTGCTNQVQNTAPTSGVSNASAMRVDQLLKVIEEMVVAHNYGDACNTLAAVDIEELAAHSHAEGDVRYLAVAEDTIVLPGLPDSDALAFGRPPYREIPGTSDCIEDMDWQIAATRFAEKFNRVLRTKVESNANTGDSQKELPPEPWTE